MPIGKVYRTLPDYLYDYIFNANHYITTSMPIMSINYKNSDKQIERGQNLKFDRKT